MTCYIQEEHISRLHEGIETLIIRVRHKHDLEDLAFHAERGGKYDVVEWLLAQLGRPTELGRVCGLSVAQDGAGHVHVTIELRQPGKQLEEWLRKYVGAGHGRMLTGNNAFTAVMMDGEVVLCERALSREKFTDKHKPWWQDAEIIKAVSR